MRRLLPASLTSRLVVTSVLLVAVVSVLIAAATTLAIRSSLVARLDQEVRAAATAAQRNPAAEPLLPPEDAAEHERGEEEEEERERGRDVDAALGPGSGMLTASLTDTGASGSLFSEGRLAYLSPGVLTALDAVPADGAPRTVELPSVGAYRVVATRDDAAVRVAGLPLRDVDATVASLLRLELLFTRAGGLAAGGLALVAVRRQMRPLRQVADTAHEVAALPLSAGEVGLTARVPAGLTDERTEVGQVAAALNTLLGHVEHALDERHRSEQQVRQFVADASHELRTPLATIRGYAELSRRPAAPDAAQLEQAMAKVEVESARMSALVEDLLLLARLDAGRPLERRPVDLSRLLVESTADARVLAPDHRWLLDLPGEPVVVTGDEGRLHQVVTNLLSNARRHTPAGTTVTVGVLHAGPGGRDAIVTVADDGPGVPEQLRAHVFERFTRGDSARTRASGGAGLGLSLVRAIVEAHGGDVQVASEPGRTVFTLRLPS